MPARSFPLRRDRLTDLVGYAVATAIALAFVLMVAGDWARARVDEVRCVGIGATLRSQAFDPDVCLMPDGALRSVPREG